MRVCLLAIFLAIFYVSQPAIGQTISDLHKQTISNAQRFIHEISKTSTSLVKTNEEVNRRLFRKVKKIETSIAAQLRRKGLDSVFMNVSDSLEKNIRKVQGEILPEKIDSTVVLFRLLEESPEYRGAAINYDKAGEAFQTIYDNINDLQNSRHHLLQRIGEYQKQFGNLGITRQIRHLKSESNKIREEISNYRKLLDNPSKLQQRLLSAARNMPAFKKYFARYSFLSTLFNLPEADTDVMGNDLLQSRTSVQEMIGSRIAMGGPNATQMLEQSVVSAKQQLSALRDKINKAGGFSDQDEQDLADFKKSDTKSRSFLGRLEYGTNIQSQRSNSFFPATTDFGLSVGYKFTDQGQIGVGCSYKVGWGKDIRNIRLSGQGIGLRSFLDYKMKGSFYATGGFECNYQRPFDFSTLPKDFDIWSRSCLVGISKIVSLQTKFFKKTKVQLLYDFLARTQDANTQPLRFRVGYNF